LDGPAEDLVPGTAQWIPERKDDRNNNISLAAGRSESNTAAVHSVLQPATCVTVAWADSSDDDDALLPLASNVYFKDDENDVSTIHPLQDKNAEEIATVSVPLSVATRGDALVHTDTHKIVMLSASAVNKSWLARRLRGHDAPGEQTPRQRSKKLTVDVQQWSPSAAKNADGTGDCGAGISFKIWDVQGAGGGTVHPATQALFFSSRSLYILEWDLACDNPETMIMDPNDLCAKRQADRALQSDIANRALSLLDSMARCCPESAVLPVVLVPECLGESEVKHRCDIFVRSLQDHVHRNKASPKLLLGDSGKVICVATGGESSVTGIEQVRERIVSIATDPSHTDFGHIATQAPPGTGSVYQAIKELKKTRRIVALDDIQSKLGKELRKDQVVTALLFLASIGEIIYSSVEDQVLSRYIILDHQWLVAALSCVQVDSFHFKHEIDETRRYMNMQCLSTTDHYREHDVTKALIRDDMSNCPLLSSTDAQMLWESSDLLKVAALEGSVDKEAVYFFLERLLVHSGFFLPLQGTDSTCTSARDTDSVFLVPSCLVQEDPHPNVWTYMSSESYKCTLCHSWLFREAAPQDLMERAIAEVLRSLYKLSTCQLETPAKRKYDRSPAPPALQRSSIRILQCICFKSSMKVRIETKFAASETGDLRESFVDVFISLVDRDSPHAVANKIMGPGMQRLVVSGEGLSGRHGLKLWRGGYNCILDAVRARLSDIPDAVSQAICPECLIHSSPRSAIAWSWQEMLDAAKHGHSSIFSCSRGHTVDVPLICGTSFDPNKPREERCCLRREPIVSVQTLLPSIVLVGLWDSESRSVLNVGSGFIVDKDSGLIVTAAHVLFEMDPNSEVFGRPYFGRPKGRALIGVIPPGGTQAVFRYFATVEAHDILNADACVLRITTRMESDVDHKADVTAMDQPERAISSLQMPREGLDSLQMTKEFQLEEAIRIIGYNQGGEGLYGQNGHISLSVDIVGGNICRDFVAPLTVYSRSSAGGRTFSPKREIVASCLTIGGHSGGPCINSNGQVIGILSRADSTECKRCFLVPVSEIEPLVATAEVRLCNEACN